MRFLGVFLTLGVVTLFVVLGGGVMGLGSVLVLLGGFPVMFFRHVVSVPFAVVIMRRIVLMRPL